MDGEKGELLLKAEFPELADKCQRSAAVEKSSQIVDKLQGIKIRSIYGETRHLDLVLKSNFSNEGKWTSYASK